jgi:hypothetical protein
MLPGGGKVNNMPINVEIPPHYPLVASELAELKRRIGKGLLHRPEMEEEPRDIFEVIADFEGKVQSAFGMLVPALQALSDRVLAPGLTPSEEEVRVVVAEISAPVDELLEFHHDLWKRPFRADLEPGRHLLAAIVERPMRDLIGIFERFWSVIADPAAAVEHYGGEVIYFQFELNVEQESRAFAEWCDSLSLARVSDFRSKTAPASLKPVPGLPRLPEYPVAPRAGTWIET